MLSKKIKYEIARDVPLADDDYATKIVWLDCGLQRLLASHGPPVLSHIAAGWYEIKPVSGITENINVR